MLIEYGVFYLLVLLVERVFIAIGSVVFFCVVLFFFFFFCFFLFVFFFFFKQKTAYEIHR